MYPPRVSWAPTTPAFAGVAPGGGGAGLGGGLGGGAKVGKRQKSKSSGAPAGAPESFRCIRSEIPAAAPPKFVTGGITVALRIRGTRETARSCQI